MPEKRVYDLLRTNTYLMIDFLVRKLTQGLFCGYPPVLVVLYGINHVVICHAAFDNIILVLQISTSSAIHHIIQPGDIISIEYLIALSKISSGSSSVKLVDIQKRLAISAAACYRLCPHDSACPRNFVK